MRHKKALMKKVLMPTVILVLFSVWLPAENISEKIRLNGFLSQGYIYTSDNDFIPGTSKNGSFEMSEFGLTFSVDLTDQLRFGLQFLARDFGPIGDHQIELDWGFAEYRPARFFAIRAGKIKTPIGLYNEFRDTDALHPLAILPQSIYDEAMRGAFIAYNGFGLSGDFPIGPLGTFDYNVFTGTVNHPEDAPYITQIQLAINQGLQEFGLGISPIDMHTELFFGTRFIWNAPLAGLRFGGTYLHLEGKYDSLLSDPLGNISPISGKMEIKNGIFLFGELALGGLTLASEYMELPVDIYLDFFGQEMLLSDEVMQGWYVMLSYTFGDKLTLSALYDRFYADKGDSDGQGAMKMGYPNYFGWQKDFAFGIRYDINFNWTIKLEWHAIDGLAKSYVFADIYDTKRKWNMIVAKTSFNF